MSTVGKFMPLTSGRGIIVETKPGRSSVVIRTDKSVDWWKLYFERSDDIGEAVAVFSGLEALAELIMANTVYDDVKIIRIITQAWEDAPDDAETNESPLLGVLSDILDRSGA
jgi:hypothetical protein